MDSDTPSVYRIRPRYSRGNPPWFPAGLMMYDDPVVRKPVMGVENDATIDAILADLVARRLAGAAPDVEAILADHPDRADEIRARLADLERLAALWDSQRTRTQADGEPAGAALPAETQLGEFRILREIGRGGMGVVYLARQENLGREVALKVIPPTSLSETTRQRFLREAKALATLSHPHIVPVYTAGESGGSLYIAMEYVRGVSLSDLISAVRGRGEDQEASDVWHSVLHGEAAPRRVGSSAPPGRRMPDKAYVRVCLRAVAEVARALGAAHHDGVIHRDVKPGNILIDREGRARLLDFGLAAVQTEPHVTVSGEFFGTPHYVAPEQARGRHDLIGPATDVYSLGATLYECMTLSPPFDAPSVSEVLARVIHDEPAPVRKVNPTIDRDLETIAMKSLAKEPSGRYASMADLADDVDRFLAGEPIVARPVGFPTRLAKRIRRRPVRSALIALLVVALAAAGVVYVQLRRHRARTRRQSDARQMYERGRAQLLGGTIDGATVQADPAKALASLRTSAEAGNLEAMALLARAYHDGLFGRSDPGRAERWARRGAEAGSAACMNWYGFLRVKRGEADEGIRWLVRAADGGDRQALLTLGKLYAAKDRDKSMQYLRRAARADVPEAMFLLARMVATPAAARAWLVKASQAGHVRAKLALASMYAAGRGGQRDYSKARELIDQAARGGEAETVYLAAMMLRDEVGDIDSDGPAIVTWLIRATDAGHRKARVELGRCYLFGRGVDDNVFDAMKYLKPAAEAGDPEAMMLLGKALIGEREADKGMAWLDRSAEAGNAAAMAAIGSHHESRDPAKARLYYQRAVAAGDETCRVKLARMYWLGKGGKADRPGARRLLERAAKVGDNTARYYLGLVLQESADPADRAAARKWLRHAAATTRPCQNEARWELADIYATGRGVAKDEKQAERWLQSVGQYSSPDVLAKLAEDFFNGSGVRKDPRKAYRCYRTFARVKPSVTAKIVVAVLATGTEGVGADYAEARRWFREAAEMEDQAPPDQRPLVGQAMVELARLLRDGQGGGKDVEAAIRWLNRAVYLRNGAAMVELGDMHRGGVGFAKDPAKAMQWYAKVDTDSKGGDMTVNLGLGFGPPKNAPDNIAKIRMGDMYAGGEVGQKDYAKAYECYSGALGNYAAGPYPPARLRMARLLLAGKGVKQDIATGVAYVRYTAGQRLPEAMLEMGRLYEKGTGVAADAEKARHWFRRAVEAEESLKDRIDKKWLAPSAKGATQPS